MSGFTSGAALYGDDSNAQIIDLSKGLEFLTPKNDGIELLKRLGTNGFTYANQRYNWTETALATRGEDVTIAAGATTLTVANANQYQVNELIKIENEVLRVTAIASATTLTVSRGYAGTTDATHTAQLAYSLGSADPENSTAPEGIENTSDRLYNYSQTFTRAVELSSDAIAELNTDGNKLTGDLKRRFIEINRQLARAVFYGVRYEDTTNNIHTMGGLTQFVTSNVTNVSGALTASAIDTEILNIVNEGGHPNLLVTSPYQKQKLDALDASLVRTGKRDRDSMTGGNPVVQTWRSGVMDQELDIVVDPTVKTDELWILDSSKVKVGHKASNGVNGGFHVKDATTPGQDGTKKVIRGKYGLKVENEKAHGYLYGLS